MPSYISQIDPDRPRRYADIILPFHKYKSRFIGRRLNRKYAVSVRKIDQPAQTLQFSLGTELVHIGKYGPEIRPASAPQRHPRNIGFQMLQGSNSHVPLDSSVALNDVKNALIGKTLILA